MENVNLVDVLYEFPCQYMVKAIGHDDGILEELVVKVVRGHLNPSADLDSQTRPSSKGRYSSVTVTFQAESRSQIENIYNDLSAYDRIKFLM